MACFHEQKIQQGFEDLRTKKFALVNVQVFRILPTELEKIRCKLCGRYAANVIICFPTGEADEFASDLVQGQQPRGHPGKPRQPRRMGHSRVPNVHLQARLLPNKVAYYLLGQAIDQTV
jgi:hypothetical protein